MPLQNRVTPEGDILAIPARGTMMGNRGGPFHTLDRKLRWRRWKTKAWICCVLEFKGRHRVVMSPHRYTELFFLDEATALAAGHRPCFECRRKDALRFAEAWRLAHGLQHRPRAGQMDAVLHPERTCGSRLSVRAQRIPALPDGTFVRWRGEPYLVLGGKLLAWTALGYCSARPPPEAGTADILTPPAIVAALGAGYRPMVHATAGGSLAAK